MSVIVVLGPTAKVDVGPSLVPFRVVGGRIVDNADVNETTDSESLYEMKEHHARGFQVAVVEFEIQLDTDTPNPTVQAFINAIGMTPGNRIPIQIWPEGRGVSNSQWYFPNMVVQRGGGGFSSRQSTPQGFSGSLLSSGWYKRPYEATKSVSSVIITRY